MSGSLVMPLLRNEIFFHAVNRIEVEKKSTRSSQFSRAKNRSVKMDVAVYSDPRLSHLGSYNLFV